jgi:DtxR family Mn-dependent transcriptional regulator
MGEILSISPALEDYLETILNLYEKNNIVRITDIAEKLNIAKASATQAVKALINFKLLKHDKYGPIELTKEGREYAERIRQRHRILKKFLIEVLNIKPEIAEKDACLMEHVVSCTTMEGLVRFLENNVNLKEKKGKYQCQKSMCLL